MLAWPTRSIWSFGASRALGTISLAFGALVLSTSLAFALCPEMPKCRGCGCKGGPGYRHIATGTCVGFRELEQLCGPAPHTRSCRFENHPNAGQNRECAIGNSDGPVRGWLRRLMPGS